MTDRQAAEARLIPVGEHECVTCLRCACTFAAVHPACPRCAAAGVEIVSNAPGRQAAEARAIVRREIQSNERCREVCDAIDALSVRLAQAEQNAGMCPVCEEWAGRGHGCEWCSEFAHESGWNDARAEVIAQAEQERDELQAWHDKVAPMTVPTAREALAEKRAKAAEVRLREYEEALTALTGVALLNQDEHDENVSVTIPIAAWRAFPFHAAGAASGGREAPNTKEPT